MTNSKIKQYKNRKSFFEEFFQRMGFNSYQQLKNTASGRHEYQQRRSSAFRNGRWPKWWCYWIKKKIYIIYTYQSCIRHADVVCSSSGKKKTGPYTIRIFDFGRLPIRGAISHRRWLTNSWLIHTAAVLFCLVLRQYCKTSFGSSVGLIMTRNGFHRWMFMKYKQ